MELLAILPLWYQYSFVLLLGLIIGSFLNVVIYRLNTGKSLNGSSHCLSCAKPLRFYELFPVVSYLSLRGRCAGCGSFIPFRYVVVELLTATLFLLAFVQTGWQLLLMLEWVMLSLLVVILVYDINHLIIPDRLVVFLALLATLFLSYDVMQTGSWDNAFMAVLSAAGVFVFFAGLWKVSGGRWMGFGDAKLAPVLALFLGPVAVFSFVVLSFWVGAIISVGLLALQYLLKRGQTHLRFLAIPLTIKSEVPFAPFIIIAFIVTYYFSIDVLSLVAIGF